MRLLETIKCKDGKLYNLEFHQARFDMARKDYFSCSNKINLAEFIQIPVEFLIGLFRCRVIYSDEVEKIEFLPHQIKKVESLKLVEDNEIDYKFKYLDRDKLNQLYEQREGCDDVLIVKNGCISDSFTANPIFFDGERWWTPNSPLLAGTQRAYLISEGIISVCKITPSDIDEYTKVGLINALQDFEDMPIIDVKNILTS